jgi:hypothetical protein
MSTFVSLSLFVECLLPKLITIASDVRLIFQGAAEVAMPLHPCTDGDGLYHALVPLSLSLILYLSPLSQLTLLCI